MNNKKYLNFNDVMSIIEDLSYSQGFYGRLKRSILELDPEGLKEFKNIIKKQKFKNNLDVIYFFEC